MSDQTHAQRIDGLLQRLRETATRLTTRLESAGPRAEHAASGWTAAQIAAHLAMVNDNLASVIDGSVPGATPPTTDFHERDWAEVVRDVPSRNESPARFLPPNGIAATEAVGRFQQSVAHLTRAIESLSPERARFCITNRVFGTISLYQTGEFAIAHMIRHNQQIKRQLEL